MKRYTITSDGNVIEAGKFEICSLCVQASSKSEASKILLSRLYRVANNSIQLHIWNGAYILIHPNIHSDKGVMADTGSLMRGDGVQFPLCSSCHANNTAALKDSDFKYYASEEFQKQERAPGDERED